MQNCIRKTLIQLDILQKKFETKALESDKRVYIINYADKMNSSSANSILKFLEEPEPDIIAILIADNRYQLLDTIVSRCQLINLVNINMINYDTTLENINALLKDVDVLNGIENIF